MDVAGWWRVAGCLGRQVAWGRVVNGLLWVVSHGDAVRPVYAVSVRVADHEKEKQEQPVETPKATRLTVGLTTGDRL